MGKPRKWTRETCEEESKKYATRYDFQMACSQGYAVAKKNGWLDEFYWLPSKPRPKKWTKELCEVEARKYSKWIDFKNNSSSAFYAAERYGWLKEFTWLEHSQKPDGYWNAEHCREEALKYSNRTDFKFCSSMAYSVAAKNKWLKDYDWLEKRTTKKWDKEACKNESLKYKTRGEFSKGNGSAYTISCQNKWIDEFDWLDSTPTQKWTKELCEEESKKYTCRGTFAKGNSTAYQKACKKGWINDYTWLKDERLDLIHDKIDSVYAYEFVEEKAVYVGRTLMRRQKQRDMEHIFRDDAVSMFAKANNIPVPEMKVLEENLTIEEGASNEGLWIEKYKENGWKILNKAKAGSLGGIGKGHPKYTRQICFELAQGCEYVTEFRKKYGSAYNAARKNGWIEDYVWFVSGVELFQERRKEEYKRLCKEEALKYTTLKAFYENSKLLYNTARRYGWLEEYTWLERKLLVEAKEWTYEMCLLESKKYKSRTEFSDGSPKQYQKSVRKGWIDDFVWLEKKVYPNEYWTKEKCIEDGEKYETIKSWRTANQTAYTIARKHGWQKEIDWKKDAKIEKIKERTIWTESACREVAEKCTTLKQYREEYASSYNAALKNGWVSDYTWLEKANNIQVKEWTREMCEAESKKYTSRSAFYKGCSSAYHKSRIEGWLDDFVWLEPQRHEKDYWTEARCEEVARSYNRMYDFQTANLGAYNAAKRNGWLKNYTWLEMVYPNMKPRGYWDDYQHCYDEAKRYTEYKSFVRKSGGAYNSALAHGWLKDYIWLQGGNRGHRKSKKNNTDITYQS